MANTSNEGCAKRLVSSLFKHSVGLFGTAITGALAAFSKDRVVAIAGIARLGAIGSALGLALGVEFHPKVLLIALVMTLAVR